MQVCSANNFQVLTVCQGLCKILVQDAGRGDQEEMLWRRKQKTPLGRDKGVTWNMTMMSLYLFIFFSQNEHIMQNDLQTKLKTAPYERPK